MCSKASKRPGFQNKSWASGGSVFGQLLLFVALLFLYKAERFAASVVDSSHTTHISFSASRPSQHSRPRVQSDQQPVIQPTLEAIQTNISQHLSYPSQHQSTLGGFPNQLPSLVLSSASPPRLGSILHLASYIKVVRDDYAE